MIKALISDEAESVLLRTCVVLPSIHLRGFGLLDVRQVYRRSLFNVCYESGKWLDVGCT